MGEKLYLHQATVSFFFRNYKPFHLRRIVTVHSRVIFLGFTAVQLRNPAICVLDVRENITIIGELNDIFY